MPNRTSLVSSSKALSLVYALTRVTVYLWHATAEHRATSDAARITKPKHVITVSCSFFGETEVGDLLTFRTTRAAGVTQPLELGWIGGSGAGIGSMFTAASYARLAGRK